MDGNTLVCFLALERVERKLLLQLSNRQLICLLGSCIINYHLKGKHITKLRLHVTVIL